MDNVNKVYTQSMGLLYFGSVSDCCGTIHMEGKGEVRRCSSCGELCRPNAMFMRAGLRGGRSYPPVVLVPYDVFDAMYKAACETVGDAIHENALRHKHYDVQVTFSGGETVSVEWKAAKDPSTED